MNLAILLYTGQKPLVGKMLNMFEIINEIVVCTASLHLCFFTDWVNDEEAKVNYGWSMVIIIALHMLFQLGTVMYNAFLLLKMISFKMARKFRRFWSKNSPKLNKLYNNLFSIISAIPNFMFKNWLEPK